MSYVKNYDVGKIQLDLPTPNYFHELPLFSFGDVHGEINLGIVFNYARRTENNNFYNMAYGYKLNLQKRIVMNGTTPNKYEDETGKRISLNRLGTLYGFDDDTQRILRVINANTYEVRNSDFSREVYNSQGKITAIYDKYGVLVLSYTYDSAGKLTSITYRNTKTVSLVYDSSSNNLKSISYGGQTIQLQCSCAESYSKIDVSAGVQAQLNCSGIDFTATVTSSEASYSTKIVKTAYNTLRVSTLVGADVVDTVDYIFPQTINVTTKFPLVEIVNKKGVRTRAQYRNGKPMYSYEYISGNEFHGDKFSGNVNVYNTVDNFEDSKAIGVYTIDDGTMLAYQSSTANRWEYDATQNYSNTVNGFYVLTGWIKKIADGANSQILISDGATVRFQFNALESISTEWQFFAYKFYLSSNFIQVTPGTGSAVQLKDLRITFKPTHVLPENETTHIALAEDVLIYHASSSYEYIPISDAQFVCSGVEISEYGSMHFEDLFKYKINRKKNLYSNELYFNKCKNVLSTGSSNNLQVVRNGSAVSLNQFYLGKKQYTDNGIVTTILKDDTSSFLVCDVIDKNNNVISSRIFDSNLDVISSTSDGITTIYTRQNDLITLEKVNNLYTRSTTYATDSSGNPTISTTDEFNNTKLTTLDSVWGNVKSVTLPGGVVVTDTYDSSASAKTRRTFAANGRANSYSYFGGNLSKVESGNLTYDFAYSKGDLVNIKKEGTLIEEHEISDTQTKSYYPSKTSYVYSDTAVFNKYGQLVSIDGVLSNTYDADPSYLLSGYGGWGFNTVNGKLATSTDLTTGNTTKFAYDKDKLCRCGIFNSSGSIIAEDITTYDKKGRTTSEEHIANNQSRKVTRTYVTSESAVNADDRVLTSAFLINNSTKVSSTNTYDSFKRLSSKAITVGSNQVTKAFTYSNTRLSGITHTKGGVIKHKYSWSCDGRMRVTSEKDEAAGGYNASYVYDSYGQLTRENNSRIGTQIRISAV